VPSAIGLKIPRIAGSIVSVLPSNCRGKMLRTLSHHFHEELCMRSVGAVIIAATLLLVGPVIRAPANAQVDSREGIALQNQVYQLRQELRALQDQMASGGGGGSRPPVYAPSPQPYGGNDLVAQLLTRVDALEEQVRQLR
jgi:hypothetical protein